MSECRIMDESSAATYPINSWLYWLRTVSTRNKYIWFWFLIFWFVHTWLFYSWSFIILPLTEFSSAGCLFFCRLKKNHDSHEFSLEFGTFANSRLAESFSHSTANPVGSAPLTPLVPTPFRLPSVILSLLPSWPLSAFLSGLASSSQSSVSSSPR